MMERLRGSGLFVAAAAVVVIAALRLAQDLFIPFALALLVSFLLGPLVTRIERIGVGRIPAVIAVVLLVAALLGGLGFLVGRQLTALSTELPQYRTNLVSKIRSLRGPVDGMGKAADDLEKLGSELAGARGEPAPQRVEIVQAAPRPLETFRTYLGPFLGPVGTAGLVAVIAIFILIQREDLRDRLIRLSGGADLTVTTQAMDEAAQRVSRYLMTTTLLNAAHGTAIGIGLFFIGVPTALLWGLLSMLLRFIPYVGPWIAASLPIALAVAVFPGWTPALMTVALFATVELVSNNALEPWLYGQSTGLSPFGVIVAAVFWAWLWGGVGLLLAIPLTVCLVVLGRYVPRFAFLPIVFGDEPVLPPETRLYQRLLADDADEAAELLEEAAAADPAGDPVDRVALPALVQLARDCARGAIEPAQESKMREMLAEIAEEVIAERREALTGAPEGVPHAAGLHVICAPASDESDALAARWLCDALRDRGYAAELVSTAALASELVASSVQRADAVCLSAASPGVSRHVRYLSKRLRLESPELEIVVGLWRDEVGAARARARGGSDDAIRWVTTLAQATAALDALAERLSLRKAVSTRPTREAIS